MSDIDWSLESNEIVLHLNIGDLLESHAVLEGFWTEGDSPTFQLTSFGFRLISKASTPVGVFLASTLWAILGMAVPFKVRIPSMGYDIGTSFELSLDEVRYWLRDRSPFD